MARPAGRDGIDLRTAMATDIPLGARCAQQIQEDWNSKKDRIPTDFWNEFKKGDSIKLLQQFPPAQDSETKLDSAPSNGEGRAGMLSRAVEQAFT